VDSVEVPAKEQPWADLTQKQRAAAILLGWNESRWDDQEIRASDNPMALWHELSPDELAAATVLGYKHNSGHRSYTGFPTPMKDWEAQIAAGLPYCDDWDEIALLAAERVFWAVLSAAQKNAARRLNFGQSDWDKLVEKHPADSEEHEGAASQPTGATPTNPFEEAFARVSPKGGGGSTLISGPSEIKIEAPMVPDAPVSFNWQQELLLDGGGDENHDHDDDEYCNQCYCTAAEAPGGGSVDDADGMWYCNDCWLEAQAEAEAEAEAEAQREQEAQEAQRRVAAADATAMSASTQAPPPTAALVHHNGEVQLELELARQMAMTEELLERLGVRNTSYFLAEEVCCAPPQFTRPRHAGCSVQRVGS
jgi:hypothetical protein